MNICTSTCTHNYIYIYSSNLLHKQPGVRSPQATSIKAIHTAEDTISSLIFIYFISSMKLDIFLDMCRIYLIMLCNVSFHSQFFRYSLMMSCWSPDPNQRPCFKEIVETLSVYTETLAGYLDMTSNPFLSTIDQELRRDSCPLSEGQARSNKLTALYYNVTSKLRSGRSRSPKSKSPRISPHPDFVCSGSSEVPPSPVIKITINAADP